MEKPFLKFDYSLIMILLAALIFLISFLVYNYKYPGVPVEEYVQEITGEETPTGNQCTDESDCPHPRCPGMSTVCENGYCITEQTGHAAARCIDLQTPICGNNICEGDESITCQEDCK